MALPTRPKDRERWENERTASGQDDDDSEENDCIASLPDVPEVARTAGRSFSFRFSFSRSDVLDASRETETLLRARPL